KLGWYTSHTTRPILIANAKKILLEKIGQGREVSGLLIKSKPLVEEMKTFTTGELNGRPEAASGCYDDRCFGAFITWIAIAQETYGPNEKELESFAATPIGRPKTPSQIDPDEVLRTVMGWGDSGRSLQSIWDGDDYYG